MITHRDVMNRLPKKRRRAIEARAAHILAEEMTLQELRRALKRSQVTMAQTLGLQQAAVSRLENRSDWRLSTLQDYVQAMDCELEIYAREKKRGQRRLIRILPRPRSRSSAA